MTRKWDANMTTERRFPAHSRRDEEPSTTMTHEESGFTPAIYGEVEDAVLRLRSASAIPFNAMELGLRSPKPIGFVLHPMGELHVTVLATGPDVFVVSVTRGRASMDGPNFYRTEISNEASGFTLSVMAVMVAFDFCLEGLLGSDEWPTADSFLEAIVPDDGIPLTREQAWRHMDDVAATLLGQIDINPPILRKRILSDEVRGQLERYFAVRPSPGCQNAYSGYVQSAQDVI